MVCLSSLPQPGGLEEVGREESDWLGVERVSTLFEEELPAAWLLRILLRTRAPKTLPRAPLNRHELRARRGATRITPPPTGSTPRSCDSSRRSPFNSSRISAIVPNRSRGFLARARSRIV